MGANQIAEGERTMQHEDGRPSCAWGRECRCPRHAGDVADAGGDLIQRTHEGRV